MILVWGGGEREADSIQSLANNIRLTGIFFFSPHTNIHVLFISKSIKATSAS